MERDGPGPNRKCYFETLFSEQIEELRAQEECLGAQAARLPQKR